MLGKSVPPRLFNDRNDAGFLTRQLMAHNVVEVFVPDEEAEAAQNLSRALEDARAPAGAKIFCTAFLAWHARSSFALPESPWCSSLLLYPHLANKGEVIYPAARYEHRKGWHGGSFKKSVPGKRIRRINEL